MSGIYKITNKINGKMYVGSTKRRVSTRLSVHKNNLNKNDHKNKHLQDSVNLYGIENFTFEILEELQPIREKLLEREQYYVDLWDCCNPEKGYNKKRKVDSSLGLRASEETKQKMREAAKNRPPRSEETRRKLSLVRKGCHHTEEAKQKMRLAHLGKKPSLESIQKRILKIKGRKQSPEVIEHRRQKLLGRKLSLENKEKIRRTLLGRKRSPEAIKKRSNTMKEKYWRKFLESLVY